MPNLNYYSKLIGAIVGNIVAILLAWLAVQFPALVTCIPGPEGTQACTMLGFTQAQITGALMFIFNTVFVYAFPPNQVTPTQSVKK